MNKRTTTTIIISAIAAAALLLACANPVGSPGKSSTAGSVRVKLGGSARTIVPDFSSLADSYAVTLRSGSGFPDQTAAIAAGGTYHDFANIPCGDWSASVQALKDGLVLAAGSAATQSLAPGGDPLTFSVTLYPAQTSVSGTGNVSFEVRVPATVDAVGFVRTNLSSGQSSSADIPVEYTGGYYRALYTASGIAAGAYSLTLTVKKSGVSVGVFRETVTVWSGCTSDKWVASDGSLLGYREFAEADLGDSNAALSALGISSGGSSVDFGLFSWETTDYGPAVVGKGESLVFTPTESATGQTLSYKWNGSASRPIVSGQASPALALVSGTNELAVTVQAANRSASTTYTVRLSWFPAYRSPAIGLEMIKLPGGDYTQFNRSGNTRVASFYLGKYEITQAQYYAVTGSNPSSFTGDLTRPVENLNWYSAIAFCNKLSVLEDLTPVYSIGGSTDAAAWGSVPATDDATWDAATVNWAANGYRLPTEAEWEYAAREVGASTADYAGGYDYEAVAWYSGNASLATHPVGGKACNALGFYDMTGNVWEINYDWYSAYTSGDLVNPSGPSSGTTRSLRGGAYDCNATGVRLDNRFSGAGPQAIYPACGFRVARNGQPLYSIEYHPNGADRGFLPTCSTNHYVAGTSDSIDAGNGSLVKTDCFFMGWNHQADGLGAYYVPGDNLVLGSSTPKAYAQWTAVGAAPNLLANPGWESGGSGWIMTNGGEGWGYNLYSARTGSGDIAGSYGWCYHAQTVDLIAAGYTPAQLQSSGAIIRFAEWMYTRDSGSCSNMIRIELLDSSNGVLATVSYNYHVGSSVGWNQYAVQYRNYSGLAIAKARVTGGSVSDLGWLGNYGGIFDDASLTVLAP